MTSTDILKAFVINILFIKTVSSTLTNISNQTVILVVAFDGFGAEYFKKASTPALDVLKASGVTVPYMEPVFPTTTFPNMQTIVTGLYPESHGIVNNIVFEPKLNLSLNGFSDNPKFWNYDPDVLPIWIRNEMAGKGRISGCLYWPGCKVPYGRRNMLPTYYQTGGSSYSEFPPWEFRVTTAISWMTNPKKPANLVFLYYAQPDNIGHAFGPNSPEMINEIKQSDNRAGYLVQKLKDAGIYDRINLVLLSDHGCAEVAAKNLLGVTKVIDEHKDLIVSHCILVMAATIQLNAKRGKLKELHKIFQTHSTSYNYTVWRKEDMPKTYFYTTSRRNMDLVLVADAGYVFRDDFGNGNIQFNMRERKRGTHGYENTHALMRPFFIASGPAFRKALNHPPFKNVDIVPMISNIIGIADPPNNGSFNRVSKMINPSNLNFIYGNARNS